MRTYRIGLIFSTSGAYAALGQSALAGATMAVEEVNAAGRISLDAVHCDPEGVPENYERLTETALADGQCRHIVGGITSWSRKDMIPILERRGALLWYPCPYEGFESNDHVVYLGACPNQHLIPLIDHVIAADADSAFLVGSNYVWGWETLRVARARIEASGAVVTGERYVPLGDTDCARLIEEIARTKPAVIVNSLIGPSNHAFMKALSALIADDADFAARGCRVVSANQTEADLDALGLAADGMLSMGAWFESLDTDETRALTARAAQRFGPDQRLSCNFATSYMAVHLLAKGLIEADTDSPRAVLDAVQGRAHDTVLGPVVIDPVTRHATLTPRLAVVEQGRFRIISESSEAIAPDPYLTRASAPQKVRHSGFPGLKVVK
ncbi:MAG: transporter substrate-binding protein [Paracoccaceae bacterium]